MFCSEKSGNIINIIPPSRFGPFSRIAHCCKAKLLNGKFGVFNKKKKKKDSNRRYIGNSCVIINLNS